MHAMQSVYTCMSKSSDVFGLSLPLFGAQRNHRGSQIEQRQTAYEVHPPRSFSSVPAGGYRLSYAKRPTSLTGLFTAAEQVGQTEWGGEHVAGRERGTLGVRKH